MKRILLIGADGGGSKTRIRVMNGLGEVLGDAAAGMGNIATDPVLAWRSVADALALVMPLEEAGEFEVHALLGMAGTESREAVRAFVGMKPDFVARLEVVSDAHIACAGAHMGKDGAIVIVGTGICAYQMEGGEASRAGGWGFPHSDEGSGAWMGMKAARAAFQAHDGVGPGSPMTDAILGDYADGAFGLLEFLSGAGPAAFGELAPYVVEHAADGDETALAILDRASAHVDDLLAALAAKQKSPEPLPLVLTGGLANFVAPRLSPAFRSRLKPRATDPVSGAMLLLQRGLGM